MQCTLDLAAARRCLDVVLAERPDVVLLQEWAWKRLPALTATGDVSLLPGSLGSFGHGAYRWFAPITGGCAVGLLAARFDHARGRLRSLSLPGRSEGQRVQPGRTAVEVRAVDRLSGRSATLLSYHLIPGAQRGTGYDPDRPHQAHRHRSEKARLQRCIDRAISRGDEVIAGGDSNYVGFALDGLASAWTGRSSGPSPIDDVFATTTAQAVTLVETESDHRVVLVDY